MKEPNPAPIDEPRLTAYALGELSPELHAAMENEIARNPAAQAAVQRIRDLSSQLKGALLNEPLPPVRPVQLPHASALASSLAAEPAKILRFPYYWVASLAAACFAVIFTIHQNKLQRQELTKAVEGRKAFHSETKEAAVARELAIRATAKAEALADARHEALSVEPAHNSESYTRVSENTFLPARQNPLSTFSADVDTASYANIRRFLASGQRPPQDAVRIEELVNYFNYRYPAPEAGDTPFATTMEIASAPWNPAHRLVRIGIKGREIADEQRPPANLVFLLDVSSSMHEPRKLPLVKESMRLLVEKLKPSDRVSIVTYAGEAGLALPSTPIALKREVLAALEKLTPGGSTHGSMGIHLAYDIARANFLTDGINRVILCTDGDFNLGATSDGELTRLIESTAKSGVYLSVLGFGIGNLKDSTLERLADLGNGNYGYIDTLAEAKRLLVAQATSTLMTIAQDVKLQVEFNPTQVAAYRLLGYENRRLENATFNNDSSDAGEIGAGHTVTALYEVIPVGQAVPPEALANIGDPLKYSLPVSDGAMIAAKSGERTAIDLEMLTLKIRYKAPQVEISRKVEIPVIDQGKLFADASIDFQFAASVAGFGMILRQSPHKGDANLDDVLTWAGKAAEESKDPQRKEFIEVVKKAKTLNAE